MADDGAGRCLSDLSDDLLRHILFMAPDKEGASTAILSRRWRWLWRTSGAVVIDSRSFNGGSSSLDDEGFLSSAEKTLAAAAAGSGGKIRRLTFFIKEEDYKKNLKRQEDNIMEALVSKPAVRHVEELQIIHVGGFTLSFGSVSSEALRVLRLIGCSTLTAPPPGATEFRMLVELHLQRCDVSLTDFKEVIVAAPRLSTLHLKSSTLRVKNYDYYDYYYDDDDDDDGVVDEEELCGQLLVPAVTTLVVEDCEYGYNGWTMTSLSLELDVPRLQYFRYKGHIRTTNLLSLKPQGSSNMIEVDLELTSDSHGYTKTPPQDMFRQFLQNFNTTKRLKLKMDFTGDHLALEDKAGSDEILGGLTFCLLDQLEVETEYKPRFERPLMVVLANLLHSCPVVRDLQLRFRKQHEMNWVRSSINKEAGVQFDRSVNGFRNRRSPMVSLDAEDDDNYYQPYGIIPCLAGEHSFTCLQSHLKSVSLQFFMDEPNCFEVQLAKFFAENALVLQEIHIDDGCHEMLEHVNPTVRRWIAKTDKGSKELNVKD